MMGFFLFLYYSFLVGKGGVSKSSTKREVKGHPTLNADDNIFMLEVSAAKGNPAKCKGCKGIIQKKTPCIKVNTIQIPASKKMTYFHNTVFFHANEECLHWNANLQKKFELRLPPTEIFVKPEYYEHIVDVRDQFQNCPIIRIN